MKKCLDILGCESKQDFPDLLAIMQKYEEGEKSLSALLGLDPKKITCFNNKAIYFEYKNRVNEVVFEDQCSNYIDYDEFLESRPNLGWAFKRLYNVLNVYYIKTRLGANLVFTIEVDQPLDLSKSELKSGTYILGTTNSLLLHNPATSC